MILGVNLSNLISQQQSATISNKNVRKPKELATKTVLAKPLSKGSNGGKHRSSKLHNSPKKSTSKPEKSESKGTTPKRHKKIVALDCEMVGVGPSKISVLARVSIVNYQGKCIFDSFVQVKEPVTDYRTEFSGIRREDLESEKALPFGEVRARVQKILSRSTLIGHGLKNDLAVLHLNKSSTRIRDTSCYLPYMAQRMDGTFHARRLRDLVWEYFGVAIQSGEHNPFEDAWAAMSLYKLVEYEWEEMYQAPNDEPFDFWPAEFVTNSMKHQLCAEAAAWVPQDVN